MSTNLEYSERKRPRKRESRRQAREAQREKERQRARTRDKKTKETSFVERTTLKFCSGGEKMRNAGGHQGEMSGSEKKKGEQEHLRRFPIKRVTRKILEV